MACSCGGDKTHKRDEDLPLERNPVIANEKAKMLSSDLKSKVDSAKEETTKSEDKKATMKRRLAKRA